MAKMRWSGTSFDALPKSASETMPSPNSAASVSVKWIQSVWSGLQVSSVIPLGAANMSESVSPVTGIMPCETPASSIVYHRTFEFPKTAAPMHGGSPRAGAHGLATVSVKHEFSPSSRTTLGR